MVQIYKMTFDKIAYSKVRKDKDKQMLPRRFLNLSESLQILFFERIRKINTVLMQNTGDIDVQSGFHFQHVMIGETLWGKTNFKAE